MIPFTYYQIVLASLIGIAHCQTKVVLTNDDGWAVAQIRAQNDALKAAGYNVILSAPAENQSGTGSKSAVPTPLTDPCQFDSCPAGSPAEGFNASDPRLNYVNSFPVDAVRFGIQTLSPKFFGSAPDFVVSGPNIGFNLGPGVSGSGSVGAASEAAIEGIPAIAVSGESTSSESYTTLESDPNSLDSLASKINSQLTVKLVNALLASPARPVLPSSTILNVNLSPALLCSSADQYKFILTRLLPDPLHLATDVSTCGVHHLPDETTTMLKTVGGCHVTVSVIDATTKSDVDVTRQAAVLDRLSKHKRSGSYSSLLSIIQLLGPPEYINGNNAKAFQALNSLLFASQPDPPTKLVLTNDDGWAVAQIRAQNDALKAAGYNTILSAPADNQSGTGSRSKTPQPLTKPCQFDTCPIGSPAQGANNTDPYLNYVNAFPVDAVRYGINTLSPKLFDSPPEFVVSGPNIGNNLGLGIWGSGTVGAACEAAKNNIPAIAVSGRSTASVSYTTLESEPTSPATLAALTNSQLTVKFLDALLASPSRPILPSNTIVNLNFSPAESCASPDDYDFVFTRLLPDPFHLAMDVTACGTQHLPDEASVINLNGNAGCYVTVTVVNAVTKLDVSASTQQDVLSRLTDILTCI